MIGHRVGHRSVQNKLRTKPSHFEWFFVPCLLGCFTQYGNTPYHQKISSNETTTIFVLSLSLTADNIVSNLYIININVYLTSDIIITIMIVIYIAPFLSVVLGSPRRAALVHERLTCRTLRVERNHSAVLC